MKDLWTEIDNIIDNVQDIDDVSLSYLTIALLQEFEDRGYDLQDILEEV